MASTDHQPPRRPGPGPWPPAPDPAQAPPPPLSWAKRTGFKGQVSGESNASLNSGRIPLPRPQNSGAQLDLESGRSQALPTPPTHPPAAAAGENGDQRKKEAAAAEEEEEKTVKRRRDSDGAGVGPKKPDPPPPARRREEELQEEEGFGLMKSHINYELRDIPGLGKFLFLFVEFRVKVWIYTYKVAILVQFLLCSMDSSIIFL